MGEVEFITEGMNVTNYPISDSILDLYSPSFLGHPHRTYAEIRSRNPVSRVRLPDGTLAWLVTRYADARALLRDQSVTTDSRWTVTLTSALPHETGRVADAAADMVGLVRQVIEEHQVHPRTAVISDLVCAHLQGRLDEDELISMTTLLLIGGHQTTVNLIGNCVHALLESPNELTALRTAPEILPSMIEELLLLHGPTHAAQWRHTTVPVTISGTTIPAGETVVLSLASANRDPEHFTDPDRMDCTRDNSSHLGFGQGLHHCPGAALVRAEVAIALSALFHRLADLKLANASQDIPWRFAFQYGPGALPVTFTAQT